MAGRHNRAAVAVASLTCSLGVLASAPAIGADGGVTSLVSVSSSGQQGNGEASDFGAAAVSREGRFVAFISDASNLVPGDTNRVVDVFVRDRLAGVTRRVSVSSSGQQANNASDQPAISANGRFVAFSSTASNLVPGDTNGAEDIFVRDMVAGTTRRVSVSSSGRQGDFSSFDPAISADGRSIAFASGARNLVPGDTNAAVDVFVRDLLPGVTTRVSLSSSGQQGEADFLDLPNSFDPAISADGRFVAFASDASTLASGDTNSTRDIFVRDRRDDVTRRISVSTSGRQGNSFSSDPSISTDGRFVAFASEASNLVTGDTNDVYDVFVRDLLADVTRRISVSSSGRQGNGESTVPAISADGRSVVFASNASNLVPHDTNNASDVFARDPSVGG